MPETTRRAFLDASVLRDQVQTELLLTLADRGAFEPQWSAEVLDEVRRNRPPRLSSEAMDRRLNQLTIAFPKAMVSGYGPLMHRMRADAKGKHILAAAVHGESTLLATENVEAFDPPSTGPYAVQVQKTSSFLNQLAEENSDRDKIAKPESTDIHADAGKGNLKGAPPVKILPSDSMVYPLDSGDSESAAATLIGPDGLERVVPAQMVDILQFVQAAASQWLAVQVGALRHELPIDEAAAAIGMSRDELRFYVARGDLLFRSTDYVDWVNLVSLLAFHRRLHAHRREILTELANEPPWDEDS